MKKALIVDWFDKYGGAERVVSAINRVIDFHQTYTLINVMNINDLNEVYGDGSKVVIKETILRYSKKKFRAFFFLFHFLIDRIKIDKDVEIIFSSSHAVAKGVRKSSPDQIHVSYFQARNFKYIWEDKNLYFNRFTGIFEFAFKRLRKIDIKHAQRPDYIIANSFFVKEWIKEHYNRDSVVIYPPVNVSKFDLVPNKSDYFIAVGRLEPYKRFDLLIKAFNQIGEKLIIIGDGSQMEFLKKNANDNISFMGFLQTKQINRFVGQAKAFLHVGVEDFGIAPIEAQACGTPVIGLAKGGLRETVIHGKTGIHFFEQTVNAVEEAVRLFEKTNFNPEIIRENAKRFGVKRFENEIQKFMEEKYKEHKN